MKRRLARRLRYAQPNYFCTLTTSPRTASTPNAAFETANAQFSVLMKRWHRKTGGPKPEYFLVWERTKKGWPHAHVLLKAQRVSKHWLSANWRSLTGSYIVDLQELRDFERAASYVSKYLAKDPQVPPGYRRWRRSSAFFNTKAEPRPDKLKVLGHWERESSPLKLQAFRWAMSGLFVWEDRDGHIHAKPSPQQRAVMMASTWWRSIETYVWTNYPNLSPYSP